MTDAREGIEGMLESGHGSFLVLVVVLEVDVPGSNYLFFRLGFWVGGLRTFPVCFALLMSEVLCGLVRRKQRCTEEK